MVHIVSNQPHPELDVNIQPIPLFGLILQEMVEIGSDARCDHGVNMDIWCADS